jgi:hypothetical protein
MFQDTLRKREGHQPRRAHRRGDRQRSPILPDIEPVRTGFFDLCIVDIYDTDLGTFSMIYHLIEPVMRAGSSVILLARRPRGLELQKEKKTPSKV